MYYAQNTSSILVSLYLTLTCTTNILGNQREQLCKAVESGDENHVRHLMIANADPNTLVCNRRWSPLACAAHHGRYNIMELLLGIRDTLLPHEVIAAHPDVYYNNTPLETSPLVLAAGKHTDCTNLLLRHNPNLSLKKKGEKNTQGERALLHASLFANAPVVTTLLRHRVDPNCRDGDGYTPLMRTVDKRSCSRDTNLITQTVKILLACRADTSCILTPPKKVFSVVNIDAIQKMLEQEPEKTPPPLNRGKSAPIPIPPNPNRPSTPTPKR